MCVPPRVSACDQLESPIVPFRFGWGSRTRQGLEGIGILAFGTSISIVLPRTLVLIVVVVVVAHGARRIVRSRHERYAESSAGTPSRIMIQLKSYLNCIDNSGAAIVECVQVLRRERPARIGDRIVVVVQKQRSFGESGPGGTVSVSAAQKVRRGDIRHAVVVRTAKKMQRKDGSSIGFDDNACVLINKTGEPIGTRLNGVVGRELRHKGWSK